MKYNRNVSLVVKLLTIMYKEFNIYIKSIVEIFYIHYLL